MDYKIMIQEFDGENFIVSAYDGEPMEIEGVQTIVGIVSGSWSVTDATTGLSLAKRETKELAIDEAKKKLIKKRDQYDEKLDYMIEELKENGIQVPVNPV